MRLDRRSKQAHEYVRNEDVASAWPIVSELLNENPDDPEIGRASCRERVYVLV